MHLRFFGLAWLLNRLSPFAQSPAFLILLGFCQLTGWSRTTEKFGRLPGCLRLSIRFRRSVLGPSQKGYIRMLARINVVDSYESGEMDHGSEDFYVTCGFVETGRKEASVCQVLWLWLWLWLQGCGCMCMRGLEA